MGSKTSTEKVKSVSLLDSLLVIGYTKTSAGKRKREMKDRHPVGVGAVKRKEREMKKFCIVFMAAFLTASMIVGCGGGGSGSSGGNNPPTIPNEGDGLFVRDSNSLGIYFNNPTPSRSRLTDSDTVAANIYLEGDSGFRTETRSVNRRLGSTIFNEVPNQNLVIVFDETKDLQGEVRVGKTTSVLLQPVPTGSTSWVGTFYLGGSYSVVPVTLTEAVTLLDAGETEGTWSEKQVIAGPINTEAPDYDASQAGTQGASVYYGRADLFSTGRKRWTISVLVKGLDEGTGQVELSLLDSTGAAISDGTLISSVNGVAGTDNPLTLAEGLNQVSVQLNDGQTIYTNLEATLDAIAEFSWQFTQGTISGGGGHH